MQKELDLILSPEQAYKDELYKDIIAKQLEIKVDEITHVKILRKSIDARSYKIKVNIRFLVYYKNEMPPAVFSDFRYKNVENAKEVIIVGAGPAGLFAALKLLQLGIKPIVIERGKDVSSRKKDIALISRLGEINPESNYSFGEGGAGAFSDGKLFTRSKKRGNINEVLKVLHFHGANESILYEAHPHIGTDKLPTVIKNIRKTILDYGGKVLFETKLIDFIIEEKSIKGILTANGDRILADNVILATGHSARDIYTLLNDKIALQEKSFAVGVRVEHPQELIDSIQYSCSLRGDYLPAASYSLNTQVNKRGVYSFCMCPGGSIVPASTDNDKIVVNGMSSSLRNSPFANSGIAVEVIAEDLVDFKEFGVLAGMKFQEHIESLAYLNGGNLQTAPAQRLHDFVNGKLSPTLPESSYIPGISSSPIHFWLPSTISEKLQQAFVVFGKRMKGFLTNDAIILAVESRTSSPVTIPRDKDNLQNSEIKGLYPCGEGAGYAGGIMSSAIDGERCANAIADSLGL